MAWWRMMVDWEDTGGETREPERGRRDRRYGITRESGMCVYVCAEGPRGHESQKSTTTTINREPRPQLDIIKDF